MTTPRQKLSEIGRQAAQTFNWPTVDRCATQILHQNPKDPEGYFLRGLAEKAQAKQEKAIESFEVAVKLNEGRYDAAVELANLYAMNLRNEEAATVLDSYSSQLINSPRYSDLAATIYTQIGLIDQAWPLYLQANSLQPNIELFQSNMAACAVYLGKTSEAKAIYKNLLNRSPHHQRNHYHLSRLEKAIDGNHINAMKASLAQTRLPSHRNIFMNYAIGKELEDLEQWEEAFNYYKCAGDAVAAISEYKVTTDIEIINKIIKVNSEEWLKSCLHKEAQEKNNEIPIFIVGLPRTGTTLTERILASHSKIESLGETQFLPAIIKKISGIQTKEQMTSDIIEEASKVNPQEIASLYLKNIKYRQAGKPFFIEKLPYNFLLLGFISRAFPSAKIIYLQRDPIDTCFAMYKQVFTWAYKFSYKLEDLGLYYAAHHKLLTHWKKYLGDRIIEVKYEELISNQKERTERILTSLGLSLEASCLEFHKNSSASTTASSVQVREKIHNHSIRKWEKFSDQLKPLVKILNNEKIY